MKRLFNRPRFGMLYYYMFLPRVVTEAVGGDYVMMNNGASMRAASLAAKVRRVEFQNWQRCLAHGPGCRSDALALIASELHPRPTCV